MNRFQFVADHSDTYPVKRLCQVIDIARSSYYAWINAAEKRAARAAADAELADKIRAVHRQHLRRTPSNFRRVTIAMRGHWGRSVVGESFGLRFEFNYDFCHRKLSVGWSH